MKPVKLANDLENKVREILKKEFKRSGKAFEGKLKEFESFKIQALQEMKRMQKSLEKVDAEQLKELKELNSGLDEINKALAGKAKRIPAKSGKKKSKKKTGKKAKGKR